MTQGPDDQEQTPPPQEPPAPPPYGQAPPPPPPQQGYPQQGYPQQGYPQAGYPVGPYGASPQAPYGIHPATGLPYSDKQKLVAGLLQILIPLGIGRFYIGDTIILATDSKDVNGLPLRS
jgi:hypothetical protein